jgi:SAM-dependent methyltransferase
MRIINYIIEGNMKEIEVKKAVRASYAEIAKKGGSCCGPSCCDGTDSSASISKQIGYSDEDIQKVPDGANLGLGCGNRVALASLKEGDTVLDLGSGAGFDSFLAADRVGKTGKVIGVDMTPEMIAKARDNAKKGDYHNIDFRLGEIENLPVTADSIDVVISNCVINLSPEKDKVFEEAFRVLKPGGRIMVSDIVLLKNIPDELRNSIEMYVSCIAGASLKSDYLESIKAAGFQDIRIVSESSFGFEYVESVLNSQPAESTINFLVISPETIRDTANSIISMKVTAIKKL